MSKISELSDGGALQSTDYLIAVRSGGNVKVQLSELPSGIDTGGNIEFGDNEKAIFGAGSDLQIYHDASDSVILDNGTGNLKIQANDLVLKNADGSKEYLKGTDGGSVRIRYNNTTVLETTATGIDVTGTVTADGLTVGSSTLTESASDLIIDAADDLFLRANGQDAIRIFQDAGSLQNVGFRNATQDGSTFLVAGNGDISFYEDTGTTAKFFWDASAQRLGLNESTPTNVLTVGDDASITVGKQWGIDFKDDAFGKAQAFINAEGRYAGNYNTDLVFGTIGTSGDATERMRIDSSGNLLVGGASAYAQGAITIASGGILYASRNGGSPVTFRRNSDDGSIITLEKDGTTVGSIGTEGGNLYIDGSAATGKTGIEFLGSAWLPRNDGANSNGAVDLGDGSNRFKDLHLSTNIHQGATTPSSSAAGVITEAVGRATYSRGSGVGGFGHLSFINGNGTVGSVVTAGSATAYNTSSDARLKENIADADDAGSKIDAIQVRQYDWKVDGSHQDYGMVAQELMTVAPEAVSGDPESDDMMGVDYSKLVPMLVKEIQSLRARVAQLEGA